MICHTFLWIIASCLILFFLALRRFSRPGELGLMHRMSYLPVVYVWWADTPLPEDHWSFRCLFWTSMHHTDVTLIANADVMRLPPYLRHIRVADIMQRERHEWADEFKGVYNPLGTTQPYELRNTLRFFVLYDFMRQHGLQHVVYMDSDAQLTAPVFITDLDGHDILLVEDERFGTNHFDTLFWVVWAGTSILSADVLHDYLRFVIALYQPPCFDELVVKKETAAPFFCDMSSWYLPLWGGEQLGPRGALERATGPPPPAHDANLDQAGLSLASETIPGEKKAKPRGASFSGKHFRASIHASRYRVRCYQTCACEERVSSHSGLALFEPD